ncbi:MAG: 50S ribosomal protein L29 [Chlamydiae bacterium]|nr:50S ribosomal protein L29 [Chlamydiota bacterium]
MNKMKQFQDQSVEELQAIYQDLSKEIFELKNEISTTRKIEKPHLVRQKKKDRARVLTLLTSKGAKI